MCCNLAMSDNGRFKLEAAARPSAVNRMLWWLIFLRLRVVLQEMPQDKDRDVKRCTFSQSVDARMRIVGILARV